MKSLHVCACRIILGSMLLYAVTLNGQPVFRGGIITPTRAQSVTLAAKYTEYTVFQMDPALLHRYVRSHPAHSLLTLEIGDAHHWTIDLRENEMRAPGCRAVQTGQDGSVELPYTECITYEGDLDGAPDMVRMNIEGHRFWGYVTTPDGRFFIEPLERHGPGTVHERYVLYSTSAKLEGSRYECSATGGGTHPLEDGEDTSFERADDDCRWLEVATESDWEFFSSGLTNGDILGNLNMVEGPYFSQFNMRFRVVYFNTWTTANDPYTSFQSGCQNTGQLDEFESYWSANFDHVRRDINVMYTGKEYTDGSTVGCASIGSFGNGTDNYDDCYGVVEWDEDDHDDAERFVITAHEMGHNFGADHDATGIMQGTLDEDATAFSATSVAEMTPIMDYGWPNPVTPDNDGRSTLRQRYFPGIAPPTNSFVSDGLASANFWIIDGAIDLIGTIFSPGTRTFRATEKSTLLPGFRYAAETQEHLILDIGGCNLSGQ